MLLSNKSKQPGSKSYLLSEEFRFDPQREAELAKLNKKQTRVFTFEQMNRYEQINRPHVGHQKRKMIEEKLELDKKAEVQANKRIKKDNLIVKYDRNPFVETEKQLRNKMNAQRFQLPEEGREEGKQEDQFPLQRDIVEAVNKLTQKTFPQFKNVEAERWKEVQKMSNTALKTISRPLKEKGTIMKQQFQEKQVKQLTFDDIIQIEEESYYAKNQIQINIFQFMKGNHKSFVTNSILEKYYFCHISIMDKITTFRFPVVRDLSRIGRKFAKDHTYKQPSRLDNITSHQMSFKVGDVKFLDLLSVASGRFNPQIVYKGANEIEVRDDSSTIKSEISQPQIQYKQDLQHRGTCFESDQVQVQQIKDYLKLQNTRQEQKYAKKCKKVYNIVQSQMLKKTQLTGNTIRDHHLHSQINNSVNTYLEFLNNMDRKKEQPQKLIRMNKVNKNRNEAIKIRALLDSIVLKNRQEQKIRFLLQDKKK